MNAIHRQSVGGEREGKGDTNTNTMKLIEYKNNYNIDILLHFLIYLSIFAQ